MTAIDRVSEDQPLIKTYGRLGDPNFLEGLPEGSEGYRIQVSKVPITPEEKRLNEEISAIFDNPENGVNRQQPWSVVNGVLEFHSASAQRTVKSQADEGIPFETTLPIQVIPAKALRAERFGLKAANALRMIYGIESWLPDFMDGTNELYRNIPGVSDWYFKWISEESMHIRASRLLLIETDNGDPEELDEFREEVLQTKWITPHTTKRRMAIYPYPQEHLTGGTDLLEAKVMRQDGAPLSARVLTEIGSDEFYHSTVFEKIIGVYALLDPEGTKEDIYYVHDTFQMPGDLNMPNPRANMMAFHRIGANRRFIARGLYRCLEKLDKDLGQGEPFLDMKKVRDIVCFRAGIATSDDERFANLIERQN